MITKSDARQIADAMLARAALYGGNITWAILANDIPAGMLLDRDRHSAADGFMALDGGRESLAAYLKRAIAKRAV